MKVGANFVRPWRSQNAPTIKTTNTTQIGRGRLPRRPEGDS